MYVSSPEGREGSGLTGRTRTQQLGDCLGKGAFGSVYRALNWGTGETVAVKQVKLADLPKSELRVIMVGHMCSVAFSMDPKLIHELNSSRSTY